MSILDDLRLHSLSGAYPMHMPGHKRNPAFSGGLPFDIDITEIPGFDDLHDMHGIIAETAALAAKLYGAGYAFPLINGSTCGNLSAIRSCSMSSSADTLIFSPFSHQSVFHGAELCGLSHTMLSVPCGESGIPGSVTPEAVQEALVKSPKAAAVLVTSPTYEGVVSDIASIADITHRAGIPLIVDAAHGAHFGYHEYFPINAIRLGADFEIVSLHKTLFGMTQTALLLCSKACLVPKVTVEQQLRIFETSSPSYVLLAGIDNCLRLMCNARILFESYSDSLTMLRDRFAALNKLRHIYGSGFDSELFFGFDPGKIVLSVVNAGITGMRLGELLRERGFEPERCRDKYLIAMTSIADTKEAIAGFSEAVLEIDEILMGTSNGKEKLI